MRHAADNSHHEAVPKSLGSFVAQRVADYWSTTKPEVNFLVVASSLVGFYLGSSGPVRFGLLLNTLFGAFLVASGTATLNEYMERAYDARMKRTAGRPLPAGRIRPLEGLVLGLLLSAAGSVYLDLTTNRLACSIAVLTLLIYLVLYTPLKRKTPLCTLVGAVAGAMPPLIGWAAARGSLSSEAWVLYLILFLWQFPHFTAIAWMYRQDYSRAGYLMLPPGDQKGRFMATQVLGFSLLLIIITTIPTLMGQAGRIYLMGAMVLGLFFLYYGVRLALSKSNVLARRVVLASVVYLPLIYILMMVNKTRV